MKAPEVGWYTFRTVRGSTSIQLTIPPEYAKALELRYGSTVRLDLVDGEFPDDKKLQIIITNADDDVAEAKWLDSEARKKAAKRRSR